MKNRLPHALTVEELYALEQRARALRAAEIVRLFRALLRTLLPRPVRARPMKGLKGLHHA